MINPFDDKEYFYSELNKAMAKFPAFIKKRSQDYKRKQKFLKKTWGPAIKQLLKAMSKETYDMLFPMSNKRKGRKGTSKTA